MPIELTPDLFAWLHDAITQREEAAYMVAYKRIVVEDEDLEQGTKTLGLRDLEGAGRKAGLKVYARLADHIILHDPEAVLRRCATDRRFLARHTPRHSESAEGPICTHDKYRWPCPDFTDLAEGYGRTGDER